MNATSEVIWNAAVRLFAERGTKRLTVQELAESAGVARGTVYSHVGSSDGLFEKVASQFVEEMDQRMLAAAGNEADPARRLYLGLQLYLRRAHEEPAWGRFLVQFAMSEASLQGLWAGQSTSEILKGLSSQRFRVGRQSGPSIAAFAGGSLLAAMLLVLEGHRTWRQALAELTSWLFHALGLDEQAIQSILESSDEFNSPP